MYPCVTTNLSSKYGALSVSQKAPWASPPCHPPTLLQVTIILTSIATCYLFFKIIFDHLFMAVLGLCCFEGLFLVQASVELLSRCGAQASHCGAQPQELWHVGLVAPRHVRSSGVRDQTLVSFIGRQILYRWDTREAPTFAVLELHKSGIIYLCSSVSGFFHSALICVAVIYSFTDA